MSKPLTKASWIGKAAYEIGAVTGCDGAAAHRQAVRLADDLSSFGIDFSLVEPRLYARGTQHVQAPTAVTANDNAEKIPMRISLWGDSHIFQLDIHEDREDAPFGWLEARVPIDFLRGIREAKEGAPWRDAMGSTIVPTKSGFLIGLADRHGGGGVRLDLDHTDLLHLELALSTALNNGDERARCDGLTGTWVAAKQQGSGPRRAA